MGITPFFFSVVALLALFSQSRTIGSKTERFLTIFFATTLVLMILKRFGNVLINWIGALPISEMVLYPKYQEPLMALCIAMLGGIGFAALMERRATIKGLMGALAITLAIMLGLAASYFPAVRLLALKTSVVNFSLFFFISIGCGVALLLVVVALCCLTQRAAGQMRTRLARGAVVLLSLELLLTFVVPSFYMLSSLAPLRADPYKGAPYIDFVHAANTDQSRIFARDGILYPNWSSAFELADVRNLDAMQSRRYRNFIRNFLLPPGADDRHDEQSGRPLHRR